MSAAHTPGPWRYFKAGNGTRFRVTARAVGTPGNYRDDFCTVDIQHEPDARLIAAAPELLEALRIIADSEPMDGDSFVCDFDTLQGVARAALAKVQS